MSSQSFDDLAAHVYAYARTERGMSVDHALRYALGTAGNVRRAKAKVNRRSIRRPAHARH